MERRCYSPPMLSRLTDRVRTTIHAALSSTQGDGLPGVKRVREVLATANDLVGRPFCSRADLEERAQARASESAAGSREAAPVMLYFDGKDHRTKRKLEE